MQKTDIWGLCVAVSNVRTSTEIACFSLHKKDFHNNLVLCAYCETWLAYDTASKLIQFTLVVSKAYVFYNMIKTRRNSSPQTFDEKLPAEEKGPKQRMTHFLRKNLKSITSSRNTVNKL